MEHFWQNAFPQIMLFHQNCNVLQKSIDFDEVFDRKGSEGLEKTLTVKERKAQIENLTFFI